MTREQEFNEGVLHEHIASFRDQNPHARVWSGQIVHGNEDEEPAGLPACEGMSKAFREHLLARGVRGAHVIEADSGEHPWADYHRFTRIPHPEGDINVDWTARQFRNLDSPVNPEHYEQTEKVPLVWRGHAREHPVTDLRFARETKIKRGGKDEWE